MRREEVASYWGPNPLLWGRTLVWLSNSPGLHAAVPVRNEHGDIESLLFEPLSEDVERDLRQMYPYAWGYLAHVTVVGTRREQFVGWLKNLFRRSAVKVAREVYFSVIYFDPDMQQDPELAAVSVTRDYTAGRTV